MELVEAYKLMNIKHVELPNNDNLLDLLQNGYGMTFDARNAVSANRVNLRQVEQGTWERMILDVQEPIHEINLGWPNIHANTITVVINGIIKMPLFDYEFNIHNGVIRFLETLIPGDKGMVTYYHDI